MNDRYQLHIGDCLEVLKSLPDGSVDAVITDPPYGLSFMGKRWDASVPSVEVWEECLRVAKPGAHLLSFAGTRTQHRMAVAIEDAGWFIRDMIAWVYGSGFPKSHNLEGDWQGWGTALKPSLEPITLARKPFKGTVVSNVLEHGTGAINVDGCRVGTENTQRPNGKTAIWSLQASKNSEIGGSTAGRWPANLIHDGSDEVLAEMPIEQRPHSHFSGRTIGFERGREQGKTTLKEYNRYDKSGPASAARFFYCAKASKADRDEGLEGMEKRREGAAVQGFKDGSLHAVNITRKDKGPSQRKPIRNHHPTVKPTDLMRYLCRLVTPPGGIVLDPFMGSGSTGKAALLEGLRFIGIEREEQYLEIAKRRIEAEARQKVMDFGGPVE